MDWSNEPYVRVYTRETDDDLVLSWDALCVWRAMLLRFDRSGMIETRRGARGLAAVLRAPFEVVERSLPELIADGRIEQIDRGFVAPNFMEAQEATKSDKLRQKESRDRRRARNLDRPVTKRDANVTSGHERPQSVTLCFADPDPKQSVAVLGDVTKRDSSLPEPADRSPKDSLEPQLQRSEEHVRAVGAARKAVWQELNELRAQVASELGVEARPLHFQDPGERDLGARLRESASVEVGLENARHALAVAAAEARAATSVQWLTGVVFGERSWRRALGMTVADAAREGRRKSASPAHGAGAVDEPPRRIRSL